MKTKTITLDGFLLFDPYKHRNPDVYKTPFSWLPFEPSTDSLGVVVRAQSITVEVPLDFDPRPAQVANLEAQKRALHAEFSARVMQIDKQISELTAIEYAPEAA